MGGVRIMLGCGWMAPSRDQKVIKGAKKGANRAMRKRFSLSNGILIGALMGLMMGIGISCGAYQQDNPKYRLKIFYVLLTAEEKSAFEAGNLDGVTKSLSQRLQSEADLSSKWKLLKEKEAINLFSVEDVVSFFL